MPGEKVVGDATAKFIVADLVSVDAEECSHEGLCCCSMAVDSPV